MADGTEKNDEVVKTEREEIFSKSVRAGKRTYFFDVKTTRRNDYYLTLTESKKRFNRDGRFYFEKHKIFLYKEDFEKFTDGLIEAIEYIKENAPELLDREEFESNTVETAEPKAEEAVEQETVNEEAELDTAGISESSVEEEVGEPITENFSNVEFEDLEDTQKG
jgi:hypothetical protein